MKHTRKIICIALCILTVVTMFAACGKTKTPQNEETVASEESTTEEKTREEITIEEPGEQTEKETTKKEEATTKKTETTTKKVEQNTTTTTTKPSVPPTTHKQEATTKKPTQPATAKKSEPTTSKKAETTTKKPETTKPVVTEPKAYSCGSKNHHCATKEEHTFISSLESKGCSICGSYSCRSFYAIDEWGNNCYDITKCPKYSEKKDPSVYCEHCGKESGRGDKGTCVRFTVDTKCPGCGKTVPAKTCHTH
ncbi:MAG: hypothetical protein NC122_07990 [Faecalibacterium sp.]|nr:hypothetical protein [Ruminococcus sp.]MCM1391707.1 hypothetical protein [Ruminococcus sp.]MCM1486135.1 hypothetical protein [Faecalibacterium sp.]